MSNHDDDEVALLARAREEADRSYNDALTALDRVMTPLMALPQVPTDLDERQVHPLNESWRVLPADDVDLGTGWRRRLGGIAWRVVGPVLQGQQRFNALLIEHLNLNVGGERESRASLAALISALDSHSKALAVFQSHLIRYLQQITLYVDTKDRHEAGALRSELGDVRSELGDVRSVAEGLGAALNSVTDEFRMRLETASVRERVTTETLTDLGNRVVALERLSTELSDRIRARGAEQDGLRQSVELVTAATHSMKREIERQGARPRTPSPSTDQLQPAATPDLDAYKYLAFEDRFRGPREDIVAAQRVYLPYFDGAPEVLDLGCGRGEFLELLREAGIAARGIDLNAEAVERCREQGFDATRVDALEYLRGLADESLGGLFSAQVVEHLEAEYLTRLLAEAHRVLRPGSRVVLETLNPACWTAFFSAFVRDITHRHPLHPDTLSYFLRASGFVEVEVVYRSPVPDAAKLPRATVDAAVAETPSGAAVRELAQTFNRHVDRLNGMIFAEQDYAAIARRA